MVRLLPRDALIQTGPVDHAEWNYRPVLGWIQRLRFKLVVGLLPPGKVTRLLEIGYGSGVFMPALAERCDGLFGIDIHSHGAEVQSRLEKHGVQATLASGGAEQMPYDTAQFDAVVAVSSLEFVPDAAAAAREIRRVLRPGGCLVLVTPGSSPLVDFGLRVLTGESAQRDYADRRQKLMPALQSQFAVEARRTFPPVLSGIACLYTALRMRPREIPA